MGIEKTWLWNLKLNESQARRVLKDPRDARFLVYAARRLATANLPREVFQDYLNKEDFLAHWPAIKRLMNEDSRNRGRVLFWQGIYEYLLRDLRSKGTPFVRPGPGVRADPDQRKKGEALRALRRSAKMTQAALAEKTGLTQQHIAKIEKGATRPRPKTLAMIEKVLGEKTFEYQAERPSSPVCRVIESVTTWFSRDAGMKTESQAF